MPMNTPDADNAPHEPPDSEGRPPQWLPPPQMTGGGDAQEAGGHQQDAAEPVVPAAPPDLDEAESARPAVTGGTGSQPVSDPADHGLKAPATMGLGSIKPDPDAMADDAEPEIDSSPVHLPWDEGPDDVPGAVVHGRMASDDITPEPPALAFAPAFLALDEDGQPVPDEVVEHLDEPIPSLPAVPLEPDNLAAEQADAEPAPSGSSLWTIPLICAGVAMIACCLLIPQADENGRLVWEREKLRRDLEQIQKQVDVNEEFLAAMTEDRFLAQRLAQRQMNVVRAGTAELEMDATGGLNSSPFQLVSVPPPAPLEPYQPAGGRLAAMCRNPRSQLYLMGGSLLLIAIGLTLGRDDPAEEASLGQAA